MFLQFRPYLAMRAGAPGFRGQIIMSLQPTRKNEKKTSGFRLQTSAFSLQTSAFSLLFFSSSSL
jgi:hypothetical protein